MYTVQYLLYCVILVRAQNHQAFVPFVEDDILAEHLAQSAFVKEVSGKLTEVVDWFVIWQRPVEGELVAAVRIVSEVTSIDPVGDDKYLNVVEQATEGGLLVTLHLVVGLFKFYATFFELNLHQWKAVDKDGYVVATGLAALNGNLVGYLKFVLAPVVFVKEFHPDTMLAIFRLHRKEIPELFGFFK